MNKSTLYMILLVALLVLVIVSCSFLLGTLNQEEEIDPVCMQRALGLIGKDLIVKVITSNPEKLRCEYVFPQAKVELEGTTSRDKSCTVHWGNKQGENTNWLHGGFSIGRKYDEQIVDDRGFILGNDKFVFGISVSNIATYFVESSKELGGSIEITVPLSERIVFQECKFVT